MSRAFQRTYLYYLLTYPEISREKPNIFIDVHCIYCTIQLVNCIVVAIAVIIYFSK